MQGIYLSLYEYFFCPHHCLPNLTPYRVCVCVCAWIFRELGDKDCKLYCPSSFTNMALKLQWHKMSNFCTIKRRDIIVYHNWGCILILSSIVLSLRIPGVRVCFIRSHKTAKCLYTNQNDSLRAFLLAQLLYN